MTRYRFFRWFVAGLYLFTALGCAYPISKQLREEVDKNLTFPIVQQDPTAYVGSTVIWGGEIIKTTNLTDGTEILILDTPLDYQGMPRDAEFSRGRFMAKSSQFLDPALYKNGKKITVAGEIMGQETKPLGKTEYIYPAIRVKQLHLWKSPQYMYYYSPYWDWYGPYPYYGPYHPPYHRGFYGDLRKGEEEEEKEEAERGGGKPE